MSRKVLWFGMFRRYGFAIFAIGLPTGCFAPRTDPKLPFLGQASGTLGDSSEVLHGLRCRLRLQSIHLHETGSIAATLELINESDHAMVLRLGSENGQPPPIWSVGQTLYIPSADPKLRGAFRLGRGETREIGPTLLQIAPAVNPRIGPQKVSASIAI